MNNKILLVDDDIDILEILQYNLRKSNFIVETASNGIIAIEKALKFKPDLIVLDVMMPNMDGIECCEKLRELPELENVMITFLTARNEDYSEIAGLEAGADDYIDKPIQPKVFVAKIKSLLRRRLSIEQNDIITFNDITIEKSKFKVKFQEKEVKLARKEFDLLVLLFSDPGKLFTREEIMNRVWKDDSFVGDRTIDVHIRKLRQKFGNNLINTIKGIGYQLKEQ
ncbi:MAG: DNA-binding response regulator [Flavobacteriales bacterium]|nr:DNA-binding response regulator [Flavobacteriales bacterium]|tara:strand:- start:2620 stop:3294 length:675 start_codon:yes stop_codon:yes gene_type:complete